MVYLDWAATSRPDERSMQQALEASREAFGNPSSSHPAGVRARELLESSRGSLAGSLGCSPSELVFTSGASESNWIALSSALVRGRGEAGSRRGVSVVASGVEHSSIHDNLEVLRAFGVRVTTVPAPYHGTVSAAEVADRLDPETIMVVVMAVNNVTGAIQPVSEIAAAVRAYERAHGRRILVHTDAVQALGKTPFDLPGSGADSASFSAHKIGGPRGIGALFLRAGSPLEPLARGEQERGLRAGTENCLGAAAFASVAASRRADFERDAAHARRLEALLLESLGRVQGCVFLPCDRRELSGAFSPFILSASFPPVPSDVTVRVLAGEGICVSSGSACASRSREKRERVYRAMGVSIELAASAIRISTGPQSTEEEIVRLAEVLGAEVPRLARIAS